MSSTVETNTPAPTVQVESALKRTELGISILHHKNFYLSVLVGCLLLAGAFGGYRSWSQKKQNAAAKAVYDFEQAYLVSAPMADEGAGEEDADRPKEPEEKVLTPEGLDKFASLIGDYRSQPVVIPLTLKMAHKVSTDEMVKKFLPHLESVYSAHAKVPVMGLYLGLSVAAFQEDAGKTDEAVKTLESLASSPDKTMAEDKIYLDLGRLYRLKGDETKAQAQWDHLLKNFPNSEWARLAKLLSGKKNS